MKKITLVGLAAIACMLSSCNTTTYSPDPMQPAFDMYNAAMGQNTIALDPLFIAVRLSALLEETGGDYTANPELKNTLLGNNTTISYSGSGQYYTLNLNTNGVTTDLIRTGIVYIYTNGYANLKADNAQWYIRTEDDNPYSAYFSGYINVSLRDNAYLIRNNGTYWGVTISGLESEFPGNSYAITSNWGGTYNVSCVRKNDMGSEVHDFATTTSKQFLDKMRLIEITASGKTMSANDLIDVNTEEPIRYNPICGTIGLAPGGVMRVGLSGQISASSYCIVTWMDNTSGCRPYLEIEYNGMIGYGEGNL